MDWLQKPEKEKRNGGGRRGIWVVVSPIITFLIGILISSIYFDRRLEKFIRGGWERGEIVRERVKEVERVWNCEVDFSDRVLEKLYSLGITNATLSLFSKRESRFRAFVGSFKNMKDAAIASTRISEKGIRNEIVKKGDWWFVEIFGFQGKTKEEIQKNIEKNFKEKVSVEEEVKDVKAIKILINLSKDKCEELKRI